MKLYLVQHGEALPEAVDPARPLSPDGGEAVARMARFLAGGDLRVARICHSGKLRARQTAEILAAILAPEAALEQRDGLNPKDPVAPLAAELAAWEAETLFVGHLPFLDRLVSQLLLGAEAGGSVTFRPGSVACLERDQEGRWRLQWMLRPELLATEETPSS
jgi:phosphohistidine phosphatase